MFRQEHLYKLRNTIVTDRPNVFSSNFHLLEKSSKIRTMEVLEYDKAGSLLASYVESDSTFTVRVRIVDPFRRCVEN